MAFAILATRPLANGSAAHNSSVIVDMALYERRQSPGRGRPRAGVRELPSPGSALRRSGSTNRPRTSSTPFRREFNLHELAVEDAIKAHQRQRSRSTANRSSSSSRERALCRGKATGRARRDRGLVGDGPSITVRHGETALHDVRLRLEQRRTAGWAERLSTRSSTVLVDDYARGHLGTRAGHPRGRGRGLLRLAVESAERISQAQAEVLELDGAIALLVELVERLERADFRFVPPSSALLRDVKDHLIRSVRKVEGFRELLTSVLTANSTQASVGRTTTSGRSRPGPRSSPSRPVQRHLTDELRALPESTGGSATPSHLY